jgi:hypothetical protein
MSPEANSEARPDSPREADNEVEVANPVIWTSTEQDNAEERARGAAKAAPFSVFNTREKWIIIALASFAGLFRSVPAALFDCSSTTHSECARSPLTANIYFPAIQTIANAFHTSVELINVTVTVYMVLQGICTLPLSHYASRIHAFRSAHVMGHPLRPCGSTSHVFGLSRPPVHILRWDGASAYERVLAPSAAAVFPSCWFRKYDCSG